MPCSLFPFPFRPTPLMRVLSCLRVSISPPPPGVGCANGRTICGCGRDGGLLAFIVSCRSLAERSFAFVLPDVRVFLSCLVFPAYRVGSRWSSSGPVLVSPRVSRPVRFLLRACFPPLSHPSGSVGSSPLLSRSRLGDSVAVPCHPIGAVCLLRSSRFRGGLAPRAALVLSCVVSPFSPPCLS